MSLTRRYWNVLRQSWNERRDAPPPRRSLEAEFLPAALALQEAPTPAAPRVTLWLLCLLVAGALAWASLGEIDVVASAQGRLVPDDRTKLIQPLETAVVKAIHVEDGQPVQAGDLLIELDATATAADRERLTQELLDARLAVARSQGLLDLLEGRAGQPELRGLPESIDPERRAAEERLMGAQHQEMQARLAQLDAEAAQRRAELQTTRELVAKLAATAPMVRQRAENLRVLVERDFVSKDEYLQREMESIEQERDLAAQRSRAIEIEAALVEVRRQRATLVAETRRSLLDMLHEAAQREAGLTQELTKARQRDRLMQLRAPVDGTVQQLAVHTVGGVVTPAQPLLVLVPQDHPVEAEVYVENKDIGFVHAGDVVEIKIETFPYTKYGTIDGSLGVVSDDAVEDERRGLVYLARVRLARSTLAVDGKTVQLTPGMAVTAEIKTGRRRLIEYFLSPLLEYRAESLRER